jgi:hypothetical protein
MGIATRTFQKTSSRHPFLFTARWLKKIGYGKDSNPLFCRSDLEDLLVKLATVVGKDGKLNKKSSYAEKLALCLAKQGHEAEAMELFLGIMDGKKKVLLIHDPPQLGRYYSSETANTPGKLGYFGVCRFAELCVRQNQKNLAKRLFLEIVERTPTMCAPMTLIDTRANALESLQELGVKRLRSGMSIAEELQATYVHRM